MEEINARSTVAEAHFRIKKFVKNTPIYFSQELSKLLSGHKIYFKLESLQYSNSFKIRGILNNLLYLKENKLLPKEIVTYSTGNHAYGLALTCQKFGVKSKIFLPKNISSLKYQQTLQHADEVILTETRELAEELAKKSAKEEDSLFISPSNGNLTIAGNGTACYESLKKRSYDAIFLPCGGGGLLAGSYLAARELNSAALIFGVEPLLGNDIARSLRQNSLYRFAESPKTIADGARTLGVSPKIFEIIKNTDGIYEAEEEEIKYWSCWLMHLLKIMCEPTSAMTMAGVMKWLKNQTEKKEILVVITGSNIDQLTQKKLWEENYLNHLPKL